jgi:hypothetical protein
MVVLLSSNLSCAQLGEGQSRDLSTLRSPLTSAETNRVTFKRRRRMRGVEAMELTCAHAGTIWHQRAAWH